MVKIVVAGGSGQVGREVIDALVAAKKHEITVLSRNVSSDANASFFPFVHTEMAQKAAVVDSTPGFKWRVIDYNDKSELTEALRGIHTVLSFTQLLSDPQNTTEKNLIDAAIVARVKRFAPSQWGSASTVGMPWWAGKDKVKEYLEKVNENEKILEYTLFQPGLFLDYLATPYKTAKHLEPLNTMIDFQNRRAIVVDGHDTVMTYTTVQDLAAVVVRAVDLGGEWPMSGGISGNKLPISQVLKIGEKLRGEPCHIHSTLSCSRGITGHPFTIDKVRLEDLENGILTASWTLEASHPTVAGDQIEKMLKTVLIGTLIGSAKGAWDVSDEVNKLLPDFRFTQIDDFLTEVWQGKL
ncbi:Oxidoreductase swnN [Lachnellula arida]|uniref:Oxidoreductase swnN n=1 Tax=Lachnellula arida TaxID=1316785 RepID=A0A8T9BPB2_9HELO|nr:Oxidoreductase swnN [Lachnellula arida]